jgi:hypothetical protein
MSTPNLFLNRLVAAGQSFVQSELRAQIGKYVADHREELIEALQTAQHERGREWLRALCAEYPAAAFLVSMLMNQTPAEAIVNVERFDPVLAKQLAQHLGTFENLQRHWRATQPQQ